MCPYPLSHYVTSDKFSPSYKAFLATITIDSKPSQFLRLYLIFPSERLYNVKFRLWKETTLVILLICPLTRRLLGCKQVYKIKRNDDGSIGHYKSRLAILGNTLVEGLDYNETFAFVAKMVNVCTLLTVIARVIHQMDVQMHYSMVILLRRFTRNFL